MNPSPFYAYEEFFDCSLNTPGILLESKYSLNIFYSFKYIWREIFGIFLSVFNLESFIQYFVVTFNSESLNEKASS